MGSRELSISFQNRILEMPKQILTQRRKGAKSVVGRLNQTSAHSSRFVGPHALRCLQFWSLNLCAFAPLREIQPPALRPFLATMPSREAAF